MPPPPVSPPLLSGPVGDDPPPQASRIKAVLPIKVSVDALRIKSLLDGSTAFSSKQLHAHFDCFILSDIALN